MADFASGLFIAIKEVFKSFKERVDLSVKEIKKDFKISS